MKVLLTNDDGINSPGIEALYEGLSGEHEVWILAPDGERSGMSHCITLREPMRFREVGERRYVSSGSPADCVILGLLSALDFCPDVVLSGINIGPNLGSDIVFSGTAAAARQAAFMNVPGIALSLDGFTPPFHFEPLLRLLRERLTEFVDLWGQGFFLNINSPNLADPNMPVEVTSPCVRVYHDALAEFSTPIGDKYFFMNGKPVETDLIPGTDWYAVSHGAISLSAIQLNPVSHEHAKAYEQLLLTRR